VGSVATPSLLGEPVRRLERDDRRHRSDRAKDADVSVSLNNYLFDPGTVKVDDGGVVAIRNGNARTPHTFTVVGEDVDLEARAADDRDGDD
jgi:plastocyanin